MPVLNKALFAHMIEEHNKRSKRPADMVCVGSDDMADQVKEALEELGLDYHVVADDELKPTSVFVTSHEDLGEMPLGGRN